MFASSPDRKHASKQALYASLLEQANALFEGEHDFIANAANLILAQGETYTISFAGAPVGQYKFTCLPHMATGMHGSITVQ